jgi:hypothetical protein
MVKLWLFLNNEITEADLYREFYRNKRFSKVDYRIFSGATKTVETRLEKIMEEKFRQQGLERSEIQQWVQELERIEDKERVSYTEIRPVLSYLKESLEVNPSRILNQEFARYESGELKTVTKKIADYTLELKKKTEVALGSGTKFGVEKLIEDIYGKREGLTLYSEIEGELEFLREYGRKSPKRYLGRSVSTYRKSKLKRVASWRAEKIRDDCVDLIRQRPELKISYFPRAYSKMLVGEFLSTLKLYLSKRLIGDMSAPYEKEILMPSAYSMEEYASEKHGYTLMDRAAQALGMSKTAFDLMVARHSDIFRKIAKYFGKWFLPDLYLDELTEKEAFSLIIAKYEVLAREDGKSA